MRQILRSSIFSIVIVSLFVIFSGCEKKNAAAPKITKGEFPFTVEYEINGETHVISDTVVCTFAGYDHSNSFSFINDRSWHESLKSKEKPNKILIKFEENTPSLLTEGRINEKSRVTLNYGFAAYYMGEPDAVNKVPCINYVEEYRDSSNITICEVTALSSEQLEKYFNIKLIKFQFSQPIENKFE